MESRERAVAIAEAITDKKGTEVTVLDVRGVCSFTSFFVLATGTSFRHVKTLAEAAAEGVRKTGIKVASIEGESPGNWILVDAGDVVVHLFRDEARDFYGLERLWGEGEEVQLEATGT